VPTIGYGHTGNSVLPGSTVTEHQADAILDADLDRFERAVERLAPGLSDNQFSACVSLCFNVGIGRFENSTLLEKLREKDYTAAGAEFLKWRMAAGRVLPGLVKRRAAERALFLTP
jgi:lysozyme